MESTLRRHPLKGASVSDFLYNLRFWLIVAAAIAIPWFIVYFIL